MVHQIVLLRSSLEAAPETSVMRAETGGSDVRIQRVLAALPAAWLLVYVVSVHIWRFAVPRIVKRHLRIVLQDAVLQEDLDTTAVPREFSIWKVLAVVLGGAARLVLEVVLLVLAIDYKVPRWSIVLHSLGVAAWLLATLTSLFRPQTTPIYGLLAFYCLDFLDAAYTVLEIASLRLPDALEPVLRLALSSALIGTSLSLPINPYLPSSNVSLHARQPSRSKDSPEDGTTLLSWLLVAWMQPLLGLARRQTLNDTDIWQLSPFFRHYIIYPVFKKLPQKTLFRKIYAFTAFDLAICSSCSLIIAVLTFASPYFLKLILEALSSDSAELRKSAYNLALLSFLLNVVKAEIDLFRTWHSRRSYERIRGVLITTVFDKAMRKKDTSGSLGHRQLDEDEQDVQGADAGRIMNLMNGDAYAVAQWFWEISTIIKAPLELTVATIFLYKILGWSAFVGLASVVFIHGFGHLLIKRNLALTRELLAATDRRISVVSELVASIRFLKYYAWEKIWVDKAIEARERELTVRYKSNFNSAFIYLNYFLTPAVIVFTTFFCYTKIAGRELTIPVAFSAMAVFGMIQGPILQLPSRVIFFLHTMISVRRLERYLAEPELQQARTENDGGVGTPSADSSAFDYAGPDFRLEFEEATLQYPQHEVDAGGDDVFKLRCPSFSFPKGKLSIVAGGNASGKSSLLMALLGEMDCLHGRVIRPSIRGSFAIATQDSWLEQNTILENILFGTPYDAERFDQVLEACALKPDLARWAQREHTEIGERGISLSGGQRARVALARAVYSPAPCVLLDDPLSAVDAHTARHLVEQCLAGPLMQDRTVILVTHHVKLCLPKASMIIRMSNGRAAPEIVDQAQTEAGEDESSQDSDETAAESATVTPKDTHPSTTPIPGGLISKENRAQGSVKWLVYSMYLKSAGYETWIGILSMLFAGRGIDVFQQWFLKAWAESYQIGTSAAIRDFFPPARENVNPWLACYMGISLLAAMAVLGRLAFSYHGSFKAARALLHACLLRVTNAPSRWLDENPTGRLLNRFTADINSVDSTINNSVTDVANDVIGFTLTLGAVLFIVPQFILFALSAMLLYTFLATPYVRCSRDLRRLENNHRSPLFSRFGGLLRGLKVVRAFGQQERYIDLLNSDLDMFQSMDHFFWTARFWLSLRFDFVGSLAIYVLMLIALSGGVSLGSAAFAIVLSNQFVQALHATCWSYAKLELDINSIERIHDLLETVQEPPAIIKDHRPPAHWPAKGEVDIENLSVRYAPHLPLALNGVNFKVEAGQKIGIVGRTGSGKTTLALSLLRITEPAAGSIHIDGIDISTIGLKDLRDRVTIISQESTLFEGTVRSNLDPRFKHDDVELWDVLKRVGLARDSASSSRERSAELSSRFISSLEAQVTAGAENFSQGERQLLSIARALLRRTNVFIADEATASVDFALDEQVQHTLRKELVDATVITIAHRLRTVIDVDRIVLLQDGVVKEQGHPKDLLQDPDSAFRELCRTSNELDELMQLAGIEAA